MNAPRGSLYMGGLLFFVLAAGCQGNETGQITDSLGSIDDSAAENDTASAAEPSNDDVGFSKGSSCGLKRDSSEPNDQRQSAVNAPMGTTGGLSICAGDEDWFRVVVPADTITRVGIEMNNAAGDLDLVVYDEAGRIVGSRYGNDYPSSWRGFDTDTEYFGLYSKDGEAVYHLRVVGHAGAQNTYSLHVDQFPYVDGTTCTGSGFTSAQCLGEGPSGSGLLPFPFPDPNDGILGNGYEMESLANYRFARRELIMLVRHALAETQQAFPHTKPLSLLDICQKDGTTPGYDVGDPRHPESTHDQGGNIDIAYFQTDGTNNGEIVCGDGASHADGFCTAAAAQKHIVDLPRQAFFMAKLFASARTRVVGADTVLAPLLANAARALAALPVGHPQRITPTELGGFSSKMASGSGWPYHHHHIHLSMKWWSQGANLTTFQAPDESPAVHTMAP